VLVLPPFSPRFAAPAAEMVAGEGPIKLLRLDLRPESVPALCSLLLPVLLLLLLLLLLPLCSLPFLKRVRHEKDILPCSMESCGVVSLLL